MFPNTPTRSPPGSPMSEDSVPHAIPSIASIFPPNYSGSDGSASDEMIPQYSNSISIIFPPTKSETESSESNQRFGQFSHSISSVFPPTKSQTDQSSESNQILTRFSQYSISSIFPPTKSQSESSESNQTSYSISSVVFPPTKSQTYQSSESNLGNTTSASTPRQQPNSAELGADSVELDSGAEGEEPARTLKLVWTPQLHKRFVDAVAHLGIKNAVPKTIMQLMSVDGLTRENVASHLQEYRLYLKRMQGESAGGGGSGPANGAGGLAAESAAPATDHLFASSPVPPHFLHLGLPNSDHILPLGQVAALPHHHHHQSSESNLGNTTTSASTPPPQPNSAELGADSVELDSGAEGEERARTLKLVWTPQLHKRFVDAVAHLGIKNAVPETIMQLMSVDGLTRENVASHLQKYRLYLKRMQDVSAGGGGSGLANGAGGLAAASAAPATDHLFASSPVPPHFLHLGLPNSGHFLPLGQVAALPHHHHHHPQQMVATVAHPQLQPPFHRQVGHFGSPPNGQFEHPFLSTRQSQPVHRMGAPLHNQGPGGGYGEDLELANGAGGWKVLTLFPTRDD